ncbi:MAG: FHA domain-containing protein [Bdellovibrionales bacterium]|nr:FHA domain-containing protein [Bdellovibrionales bacterium]
MFALEIDFQDGVSPPEILLVRRPHAIIGSSEYAHVLIEGSAASLYELRLTRGVGAEFRCQPISKSDNAPAMPPFLDGVYSGEAEVSLGEITTHITSIDIDLALKPNESPDLAGVRILRRALCDPLPVFPAVAVLGTNPIFLSFCQDDQVVIGRSRKCALRLDSSDVSSEHVRVGMEDGNFWVEDLGSTNGTFVDGERVSGRRFIASSEHIAIGAEYAIAVVGNQEDVARLRDKKSNERPEPAPSVLSYPCVVSESEVVRPARVVVAPLSSLTVGRDPSNDIWIGEAHISRVHLEITSDAHGQMMLIDRSSNGTFLDGERLPREIPVPALGGLNVITLGSGIELGLCSSEADERAFVGDSASGRSRQPTPVGSGSEGELSEFREMMSGGRRAVEETHIVMPDGERLGAFASTQEKLGAPEANPPESFGVFEKLAQRAGNRAGYAPEEEPFLPPNGSESTGYNELSKPEFLDVPPGETLAAGPEHIPVMGKFSRVVLGAAVVLMIVVVLLLFVWFVGPDMFHNF